MYNHSLYLFNSKGGLRPFYPASQYVVLRENVTSVNDLHGNVVVPNMTVAKLVLCKHNNMNYSSDRFLLEVTETTRPPLIIIDYSHFSCMSGNQIGTLFGIRNTLNFSLIRRYQY